MTISAALSILGMALSELPTISIEAMDGGNPLRIVGNASWCLFTGPNEAVCVERTKSACEITAERLEAGELKPNERCIHSDDLVDLVK